MLSLQLNQNKGKGMWTCINGCDYVITGLHLSLFGVSRHSQFPAIEADTALY